MDGFRPWARCPVDARRPVFPAGASAGPSRTAPSPRLKRAWRLTRRVDLKDGSERLPQDAAAQRDEVVSKLVDLARRVPEVYRDLLSALPEDMRSEAGLRKYLSSVDGASALLRRVEQLEQEGKPVHVEDLLKELTGFWSKFYARIFGWISSDRMIPPPDVAVLRALNRAETCDPEDYERYAQELNDALEEQLKGGIAGGVARAYASREEDGSARLRDLQVVRDEFQRLAVQAVREGRRDEGAGQQEPASAATTSGTPPAKRQDVDKVIRQLDNEPLKNVLQRYKERFGEDSTVLSDLADFVRVVDRLTTKFEEDSERAALNGSIPGIKRAMDDNKRLLDKLESEFKFKTNLAMEQEMQRLMGDYMQSLSTQAEAGAGDKQPQAASADDELGARNTAEVVLTSLSALAVAATVNIVWGWVGGGELQPAFPWAPPEGMGTLSFVQTTAAYTAALSGLFMAQLGLSNFVQPLKEVRDLELGNMKDQIQGVSKPLTLAFVASLAYAEMVVRGVGLTLLFRFFGDAGSSLVGPLVPEAMLDDGAALLSLRSQLGSPVALAAAQPQVPTAFLTPAVVLTVAAGESMISTMHYVSDLRFEGGIGARQEQREEMKQALTSNVIGAWAQKRGLANISLVQLTALRDTLLLDVSPEKSPTVRSMSAASLLTKQEDLDSLPRSRRALLENVPIQALRAAVIESGKLVKNGDDVRALWSALSQFLTSAFLAWETVATKSLMAPTITGATVLALAAYLSTAELPWLPVTATPRTPERGEGWAPMGSRASGQGQQVAKESGDK